MKTKPIPEGYRTLTPHLTVRNAAQAIDFYVKAFGAKEKGRHVGPDGKAIMHAALQIGDSMIMLNDESPDWQCFSPLTKPGAGFVVHLYVDDVDVVFNRAVQAGATATMPIADMFWGDRYGQIKDPFGHLWSIATRKEDVSPEECAKRMNEQFGGAGCAEKPSAH